MKLTAHNITSKTGNSTISFVVWSRKGSGMVNVFESGDGGGEMMSIEGAREYWKAMVEKHGYRQSESTMVEPC